MAFQIGDKYFHEDIESGEIIEISKSTFDEMNFWRKRVEAMIKPSSAIKGTITIHSTMADDFGNDYKDLWNEWDKNKHQ